MSRETAVSPGDYGAAATTLRTADESSSRSRRHLSALLGNHPVDPRPVGARAVLCRRLSRVLQADVGVLQRRGRRTLRIQRRIRRMTPPKTPPGSVPRRGGFKLLRIAVLLWVLLAVALMSWQDRYRSTRWHDPLYVAIYPIAADDSPLTRAYVAAVEAHRFNPIDWFF